MKYKQQIHFFPAGLTKSIENRIARIQFWNAAPRLVADRVTLDVIHDPLPQLPGNRLAKQHGYWDFARPEDIPLDLSPVVRLIEQSRAEVAAHVDEAQTASDRRLEIDPRC